MYYPSMRCHEIPCTKQATHVLQSKHTGDPRKFFVCEEHSKVDRRKWRVETMEQWDKMRAWKILNEIIQAYPEFKKKI